jgi:hypothetical protein
MPQKARGLCPQSFPLSERERIASRRFQLTAPIKTHIKSGDFKRFLIFEQRMAEYG